MTTTVDTGDETKGKLTLAERLGTGAAIALFTGMGFWGVSSAIGMVSGPKQSQASGIVVREGRMTFQGKSYTVVTSEFTPTGTFTIGKPQWDAISNGGRGREAYPFQLVEWRSLSDANPLKSRMQNLEAKEGTARQVAYSIHAKGATGISEGCVVMEDADFAAIKDRFTDQTISIEGGGGRG